MPTKPTQLRIPPDLLAQIDEQAKKEGQTRTAWLLEAAKAKLPQALPPRSLDPATHQTMARFKCPMPSCEFRAGSPAARCPHHGRLVIPC